MAVRSKGDDYAFGMTHEATILPKLQCHWGDEANIRNTKEKYSTDFCPYDFESDMDSSWEVKSRRIRKHAYATTLLGVNKVRDVTTPQYFVFVYTDKMCYIRYDKELFDTFMTTDITVFRNGAIPKPTPHYLIPIEQLIDF